MADTIRYKILKSLISHIESQEWIFLKIPVNPGKTRYQPEDLPAISFFAREEEASINEYGRQQCSLIIEINYAGIISRVNENEEKSDILEQIESVRGKLVDALVTADLNDTEDNDLADPPVYTGGDTEYPAAEDMAFITSVQGRIEYETELNDPYTQ